MNGSIWAEFYLKLFIFDEEILHISGSLLQPHTGSVSWLDKHAQDANVESNIKKTKGREAVNISVSVDDDALSLNTDHKNRKSKKHSKGSSFIPNWQY
ncbi:hypothetical protein Tco_0189403 [Tanacetum coccineum]